MRALFSTLLLLCLLPRTALADDVDHRVDLVAAINKRDVATVAKHVELPLRLMNLRFTDPACSQFAGKLVKLEQTGLEPFVGCMANLGIQSIEQKAGMRIRYSYGPGVPLHLMVKNDKVVAFVALAKKYDTDAFTIEPLQFASHVKNFRREVVPSAKIKKTIDASTDEAIIAETDVCVDARGKITSVTAHVRYEPFKAYEAEVTKVVRKWAIKPFLVDGKGVAACTSLSLVYPENRFNVRLDIPPPPPPPPPPPTGTSMDDPPPPDGPSPRNVAPTMLESFRISGEKAISPDDVTKVEMQQAGKLRVIASFKLCLDTAGSITKVVLLKTSGFPAYDKKLSSKINAWKYKPYQIDGKAVPVCTAVTFIYSQEDAPADWAVPKP